MALDAALEGARRCMDPDCRRALKALADLFALDRIYNDIVFRNDDYIAPEKVRLGLAGVAAGWSGSVVVGADLKTSAPNLRSHRPRRSSA